MKVTLSNWERFMLAQIIGAGQGTIAQVRMGNRALDVLELSDEQKAEVGWQVLPGGAASYLARGEGLGVGVRRRRVATGPNVRPGIPAVATGQADGGVVRQGDGRMKIGMHIHHLRPEVHQAVIRIQPRAVLVVNPSPQWIKDIHSVAPNCYIGVRKHEDGVPFWERVPEEWADEIAVMCGDALSLVDGAVTYNEPMPQGHDEPLHFPLFDEWQRRVIIRLQETHGVDALAFPFGTGQFTAADDRVRLDVAFPGSCEVCRIITPHDYDWPNIWKSEGWRAMRWLAWLDDIEQAGYGRKKVLVGEWGLTRATYETGNDIGWRSGVELDDYVRQMAEYNARLCDIPEAVAFCPFDWGGRGEYGWDTFEHVYPDDFTVVDKICSIRCPEIPNGGDEMFPRVLNIDNQELTGEAARDLVRYHGLTIQYPTLQAGDKFFDLVLLDEREGPACFIFTVLREDGSPWEGMETAWAWADDIGEADDIGDNKYPTDWQPTADLGPTKEDGTNAPGFGKTGWYHGPYESGPGRAWIRHPEYRAVYLMGIGMEAGTNHRTMYGTWQLKAYEGDSPTPEPPDDLGAELVEIGKQFIATGERLKDIGYTLGGAAPTKVTLEWPGGQTAEYVLAQPTSVWTKLWAMAMRRQT